MTTPANWRARAWVLLALVLTFYKLWLTRGQGVFAIGNAGHDDRLFLELAYHLIHGNWLGPYNELTLAKGPFYPMFIAGAFWLGVPLFLAQQAAYAAAAALLARALRPALALGWRTGIYLLLLWNPMTFEAPAMGRVLRQHIYGPLGLLVVAGLVALYLRRGETARRQLPWALLAGLAAGAFYLTREEVAWFAPAAGLLAAAVLVGAARISRTVLGRSTGLLGVTALAAALPVLLVCIENKRNYGWFGTSELRAAAFNDAYGAMLRVEAGPVLPFVPVTREARAAMARVSPRFAELQRQFDAGVARGWAGSSEFLTHLPPDQEQIGGGWMMWALRDAAAHAGYHHDAGQAQSFYKQLARELNRAVDEGRLPGGRPRSGFLPPWREEWSAVVWHHTFEFADFVARFSRFSARPPPSTGAPEDLQRFRDVTGERLSPPAGELDVVGAAEYLLNLAKVDRLQQIGKALRPLLFALVLLAHAAWLLRLGLAVARRAWTFPLTLACAAWSAVAASLAMHAVIETTSFPVLTVSSFAPIYPLLLVFVAAALWDAATSWRPAGAGTVLESPETVAPHRAGQDGPRWLPWLAALIAVVPFLVWQREFRELFWFGDDLFLVDQMSQMGLGPWITHVFSENFVPLFKLLWGGAVLGFGGSYAAMLGLMWLTHAANSAVLALILRRAGWSGPGALLAAVVFAATPANLETLGWSVQWSAVLAASFLLLGLWRQQAGGDEPFNARRDVLLMLLSAASACSFSRGVLTGPVLALGLLVPALGRRNVRAVWARLPAAALYLVPAIAVALVIGSSSSGNHQHLAGHGLDILEFATAWFLFNPAHAVGNTALDPLALALLAAGKLAVVGGALWLARGRPRQLLVVLLAFDVGNALLISVGRYHTGFLAALSSRYQYSALIATLPAFAFLVAEGMRRLSSRRTIPHGIGYALAAVALALCLRGWPAELATFTGWRGTELRRLLAAPATSDPAVRVPALEFMHVERAKALVRAYDLH